MCVVIRVDDDLLQDPFDDQPGVMLDDMSKDNEQILSTDSDSDDGTPTSNNWFGLLQEEAMVRPVIPFCVHFVESSSTRQGAKMEL